MAAGIEDPTGEDLRRFDKRRKGKKVSNQEWESPTDGDSRIAKMKDGTTHLAYKAEQVVDVATDLVLAATVHGGDAGDTETLVDSVLEAEMNVLEAAREATGEPKPSDERAEEQASAEVESTIKEVVADKGYHSVAGCVG